MDVCLKKLHASGCYSQVQVRDLMPPDGSEGDSELWWSGTPRGTTVTSWSLSSSSFYGTLAEYKGKCHVISQKWGLKVPKKSGKSDYFCQHLNQFKWPPTTPRFYTFLLIIALSFRNCIYFVHIMFGFLARASQSRHPKCGNWPFLNSEKILKVPGRGSHFH